ncbi:EutN/CcmL family microcompartment protein [Verrucomicrobiaceae bacterium N1E253]|uniref:EutN/CcmL family microcompartment protein n=1 Tax=Oceaniferula marina TaxID=2748318 RepID=A0A851GMZ0_9BACT|nr:EutN/CcmL family microcompartment protein [Oceaniferula marina]NWK56200.1 EutN/CcmL family microcompartment protein [Oceaniferula marina]
MIHAQVVGKAVATAKHPSLNGFKMLLCQQLDAEEKASGTPFVAIDLFGAGMHQKVFVSTDGIEARGIVHDDHSPARMFIQGVIDS